MKKLQGFDEFAQLGLSGEAMAQLKGGRVPTKTGAGTQCISPSLSASGCWAYSSDNVADDGTFTTIAANPGPIAASDVSLPC